MTIKVRNNRNQREYFQAFEGLGDNGTNKLHKEKQYVRFKDYSTVYVGM